MCPVFWRLHSSGRPGACACQSSGYAEFPSHHKAFSCKVKLLLVLEVMQQAELICGVYVPIKITTSTAAYDEFNALISGLEWNFILLTWLY